MVIAIDGPSGVGKSTVSRALAAALGVPHLDTGAYYRLATLLALRASADPSDAHEVLAAMEGVDIDYAAGLMTVDGDDVTEALRGDDVTAAVSLVAALPAVRTAVVALQRDWVAARGGKAVVEGRDIGTVVFPAAPIKVFLTATARVRAERRAGDEEASGASLDELQQSMERRDAADSTRTTSPLRPADDAIQIDTSDLGVAEVVARILDLVGAV